MELMVIPQRIVEVESINDEHVALLRDTFLRKKQELEFMEERLDVFERKLEQALPSIISRLGDLRARLQEIILDAEDDLEAAAYVEEAQDLLGDDKTHTSTLIEDAADELSDKELKKQCKALYLAIAKICHPDRHDGDLLLTELFSEAKEAYKRRDLPSLTLIYADVSEGRAAKLASAYELKIADIEYQMEDLQESEIYFYYQLNLDWDFATALEEYRQDLLEKIESLETMINRESEIL